MARKVKRSKVKVGVDADGKDVNVWYQYASKAEKAAKRAAIQAEYVDGAAVVDDQLFGTFSKTWFNVYKKPFISVSTQASYRTMLNKYLLPALGDKNLRAIRPAELQELLNKFTGKSSTLIGDALTVLRGIFGQACAERILANDPTAHLIAPKPGKPNARRALTDAETAVLLPFMTSHKHGPYLAALYYTGARPGENRGLQWGDFDWEDDTVHIQRDIDYKASDIEEGELKNEYSDRIVPIWPELRAILYPLRGLPDSYVFQGELTGTALSKASAERIWIELMLAAGLVEKSEKPWKHKDIRAEWSPLITPYYLRHNFITLCFEAGLDPMYTMYLVGHNDYRTTANIYTHLKAEHMKDIRADMSQIFENKKKVAQKLHRA